MVNIFNSCQCQKKVYRLILDKLNLGFFWLIFKSRNENKIYIYKYEINRNFIYEFLYKYVICIYSLREVIKIS